MAVAGMARRHSMANYNMHDDKFRELIEKARAKIREGDLPADRNTGYAQSGDSRHQDYCRVCEEVIRLEEPCWRQLNWDSSGRPDPHQRGPIKPELHMLCYSAW